MISTVSHIRMSEKRKVLRRCLKTASDTVDVMWNGKSFHVLAPATGNARLPTVESRTRGTCRRWEVKTAAVVLMSCRRHGWNTTVGRCSAVDWSVRQDSQFEGERALGRAASEGWDWDCFSVCLCHAWAVLKRRIFSRVYYNSWYL